MPQTHFDFVVIGGGQAGIPLAHEFAAAGKKTALIEQKHLGGSCINFGCTPTKDVFASAKLAYDARRASIFGLEIPRVEVRFGEVIAQARRLVAEQKGHLEKGFQNQPNLSLIGAHAMLDGKNEAGHFRLKAGKEIYTASQVVLDTGSSTLIPEVEGLDPSDVLTSENWLDQDELPKKLVILGSGYIGLEMGQFYRRMGSEVIVVSEGTHALPREDADISGALLTMLEDEGIQFRFKTDLTKVEGSRGKYHLTTTTGAIDCTHLFIATGREANSENLGLESVGISPLRFGFLKVDPRLATNVPGLWVAGDLRGGPLFTHTSWDDYRILKSQILGNRSRTTDRIIPYAVFTDPELGRVGLTERDARALSAKTGSQVEIAHFNFSDNLKAMELREARGFIKLVVDQRDGQLLGAAVLGPQGSELVHIYGTLMASHAPYSVIRDEIMIHPTLAEAIQSVTSAVPAVNKVLKSA
jgi:pyruvate/2-oxoglutarate dehydrogenase complex dihydrolipoamide dehydrogenase (E3) component